jgi:hypothetical protein
VAAVAVGLTLGLRKDGGGSDPYGDAFALRGP